MAERPMHRIVSGCTAASLWHPSGLVTFAVTQERPDLARAGVLKAAIVEVFVEAGVVDRVDRTEAHRHRRVLPEVRHEPRMWVARQPAAADLHTEMVEVLFGETTFEV